MHLCQQMYILLEFMRCEVNKIYAKSLLLPLRCDSGSARMMSRTPWRAASQCVTGSQNPCARWKEMSYGEVVISERSFYGDRFFYGVIEDKT